MRFTREQATVAASAPIMAAGLVVAALADNWPMRLSGAAMVIGASTALATANSRARWLGWSLAIFGALAAAAAHLHQVPAVTPH